MNKSAFEVNNLKRIGNKPSETSQGTNNSINNKQFFLGTKISSTISHHDRPNRNANRSMNTVSGRGSSLMNDYLPTNALLYLGGFNEI